MPRATVLINELNPNRISVDLGIHLTTSTTDNGWDVIGPVHINCWKEAVSLLKGRDFDIEGNQLTISVDWRPVIKHLQKRHRVMQRLQETTDKEAWIKIAKTFPQKSVKVDFDIFMQSNDKNFARRYYPALAIEYYLHDMFLIMNIAIPASCDFYNATVKSEPSYINKEVRLSNYHFESALQQSRDGKWPNISFLPLEDTHKWFHSVRSNGSLVPRSKMEKVLFSILHIASIDLSPATIIWIFHAFETLFDTKVGENFRSLISRIELLLEPNESEMRLLKKGMRELYDLRSAFVHGGLDIIHPMHNELLDKSIEDIYMRWMRAADFGFQIILASLQKIIRQGWSEPIFKEVLCDQKL